MRLAGLRSVRTRLVLLFFLITAAAVGFVYLYVVPQLESSLTSQKLSRLEKRGTLREPQITAAMGEDLAPAQLTSLLRRISQLTDSRVTILGVPGEGQPMFVLSDSALERGPVEDAFTLAAEAAGGRPVAGVDSGARGRLAEVALPIPRSDPTWIAVYSEPLGEVESNVALIKRQILIAGGIALLLALAAGYLAARALSKRLRRLEEAAQQVADGDFETPIPVDSTDELGQLAMTFNEMQRRLADLERARKQFIANASHELRTPIFSLGGFVELLEDEDPDPEVRADFVRNMREQVDRLTKLTTDLLDLSKLDSGALEIEPGQVDLGLLARQVAREFSPIADRRTSRLQVRGPLEPALAQADPERTRQIIRILLDNALRHTPEGTQVTMTSYIENSRAEITVSDQGPGISRRAQSQIFDRFYTGDSVSGSGLGLAIARELAQRMGGGIAVTSRRGFTAFTLDLPPAAPLGAVATPNGAQA